MANPSKFREAWLRPFFFYGNNRLSLLGGAITTASAMVLIGFWVVSVLGHGGSSNPYLDIVFDLILPGIFVAGLCLIFGGIVVRRSYLDATKQIPSFFPEVSLKDPVFRHGLDVVAIATLLNFVIVSTACYRGVAYMDTVSFCGSTCHVMKPEFTAYHGSPHSGVPCTECHVVPGPVGYAHVKLNGTKQMLMTLFHDYPRPIMAEDKVPAASSTCLNCHDAKRFIGDTLKVDTSFADDKANTKTSSLTLVHVGGSDLLNNQSGIHGAHMGKIEYVATDTTNETIPWVSKTNEDGSITKYIASGVKGAASGKMRLMDCVDCHNRAAHSFDTADDALNKDMAQGSPDVSLPFIHKEGLRLIKATYPSGEIAKAKITEGLITFYRSQYPAVWNGQQSQIQAATNALVAIYGTNVFPSMNVRWETHPDNIGHTNSPGCFRCHDGTHTASDGATITNDCTACHNLIVSDEKSPKLLADLGMK